MPRISFVGVGVVTLIASLAVTTDAEAQDGRTPGTLPPGAGGASATYSVPAAIADPYLNPYFGSHAYDPHALALFFLAAQRARGGIGSRRLSGLQSPAVTGRVPAEMPRSMATPGAAASRYFGRGISPSRGPAPYYQRYNRYFSSNGR